MSVWYSVFGAFIVVAVLISSLRLVRGKPGMAVAMCLFSFAFYAMFDPRKVAGTIIYWQRWVVEGIFCIVAVLAAFAFSSHRTPSENRSTTLSLRDPRTWFVIFLLLAAVISLFFGLDKQASVKRLVG
ncbi:MAG: hypothetical protein DRP82_07900, partial [Planctomycetota bacterium]